MKQQSAQCGRIFSPMGFLQFGVMKGTWSCCKFRKEELLYLKNNHLPVLCLQQVIVMHYAQPSVNHRVNGNMKISCKMNR